MYHHTASSAQCTAHIIAGATENQAFPFSPHCIKLCSRCYVLQEIIVTCRLLILFAVNRVCVCVLLLRYFWHIFTCKSETSVKFPKNFMIYILHSLFTRKGSEIFNLKCVFPAFNTYPCFPLLTEGNQLLVHKNHSSKCSIF